MADGIRWDMAVNAPSPLGALHESYIQSKKNKLNEHLTNMRLSEYDRVQESRRRLQEGAKTFGKGLKDRVATNEEYLNNLDAFVEANAGLLTEESMGMIGRLKEGVKSKINMDVMDDAKIQEKRAFSLAEDDPRKIPALISAASSGSKQAAEELEFIRDKKLEKVKQAGKIHLEGMKQKTRKEVDPYKQQLQYERQRKDLAIQTKKGNIDTLESVLSTLEGSLSEIAKKTPAGEGVDIPGVGSTAILYDLAPDALVSAMGGSEGVTFRQNVKRLFNIVLKDRSGAAVTNPELVRLADEFGAGKFKTDEQLITALKEFRKELDTGKRVIAGGYSADVVRDYEAITGIKFLNGATTGADADYEAKLKAKGYGRR